MYFNVCFDQSVKELECPKHLQLYDKHNEPHERSEEPQLIIYGQPDRIGSPKKQSNFTEIELHCIHSHMSVFMNDEGVRAVAYAERNC